MIWLHDIMLCIIEKQIGTSKKKGYNANQISVDA